MEIKNIIILIAGILIVVFVVQNNKNKDEVDENVFACTMDALMCPDGSAVGRTGLECEFSSCPNLESYTGKLEQTGEGFRLVMSSPENGVETSYVMPLQINVSNSLADLININVKVVGNFEKGNNLIVKNISKLEGVLSDPTKSEISVGETKYINGVKITLNEVVQDNRCPKDVQCIEAGAITVNVTLKSDTDTETKNMASDEAPMPFDSFLISIEDINPPLLSTETPDPMGYKITFKVVPTTIKN